MKRLLLALTVGLAAIGSLRAMEDEPTISTQPIGSPFYRHLAWDLNVDLRELVKFEKHGFGRAEIVTIVLLSKTTGAPLKDYGRRRIRDRTLLRDLAVEAGLDYPTLYKVAQIIKESIEMKEDVLLPAPQYETKARLDDNDESPSPSPRKKRHGSSPLTSRESEAMPHASATPSPAASPTPAPSATPKP